LVFCSKNTIAGSYKKKGPVARTLSPDEVALPVLLAAALLALAGLLT
jgi:hypothetical protein